MQQIPLPIGPVAAPSFDSFVPGANASAVQHLRSLAMPAAPVYLWGPPGSGKTHLLRALAAAWQRQGRVVAWLDAGIVPFSTLDEAIARVNATPFGLATGLFTNRLDDALRAARRLEVGGVHINETSSSRVDLMPYGGSKDSGFGREGPHYAVREMSEERMVTIAS